MTTESQQSDKLAEGQVVPTQDAESQVYPEVTLGCDVSQDVKLSKSSQIFNAFKINSFRKFATKLLSSFLTSAALIFSDYLNNASKEITEEKPDILGNINENAKKITEELGNNNNSKLKNIVILTAALFCIRILAGGFKRLCSTSEPEKRDVCTQADIIFTESKPDDESGRSVRSAGSLEGEPSSSPRDPHTIIGRQEEFLSI